MHTNQKGKGRRRIHSDGHGHQQGQSRQPTDSGQYSDDQTDAYTGNKHGKHLLKNTDTRLNAMMKTPVLLF
jgi:hypothetical protein